MQISNLNAGLRLRLAVASSFVTIAALSRLFPHPPNFTPVGAIALFGGAVFATRVAAYLVPLAAMLLADLVLQLRDGTGLHALVPVVYGCFIAITWLGRRLGAHASTAAITVTSLVAASGFFLLTNLAVWLGGDLYPLNGAGLLACYTAALPFFGWTAAAQGLFGLLLFGGHRWLERRLVEAGHLPAVITESR